MPDEVREHMIQEDPNMTHYMISNRVSHLLIFYLLVFDRIHDAMCRYPGPPAEI